MEIVRKRPINFFFSQELVQEPGFRSSLLVTQFKIKYIKALLPLVCASQLRYSQITDPCFAFRRQEAK